MSDNLLAIEVSKEQLPESEGIALQNSFLPFFQQAEAMKEQALAINVTSVDQVDAIKKAREWRLTLKNIRVDCEKVRKGLKEESLRKGKAIDGMANVIKFLIAPIEQHLENQENFVKSQEELRIEELRRKRIAELWEYQVDGNHMMNLGAMPDDQYALLLSGVKTQFENAVAAAKKADADRIEREKKEAAERERIKAENEARRIENEKLQKKLDIERKQREEEEEKRLAAERKLKDVKKEIKEEKKAEAAVPRARAYAAGELQLDGEDIPKSAKAGDLVIFLKDTPENRHAMAHLMRP
jgi:hypothetical protein